MPRVTFQDLDLHFADRLGRVCRRYLTDVERDLEARAFGGRELPRRAVECHAECSVQALVQGGDTAQLGERRLAEAREIQGVAVALELPFSAGVQSTGSAVPRLERLHPLPAHAAQPERHAVLREDAIGSIEVDAIHVGDRGLHGGERRRLSKTVDVRRVERELELDLHAQSSVRARQSSGKSTTSSNRLRYETPEVPPVPRLKPMTRSTVVAWRNRHWRKASSRSTSFSASS